MSGAFVLKACNRTTAFLFIGVYRLEQEETGWNAPV
jgi:hypothetical protein